MRAMLGVLMVLAVTPAAKADDCRMERQASLPLTFSGFLPTVPVLFNGRQIDMGLDIGAQTMMVTPDTAEQLNLPRDPRHSTRAIGTNNTTMVSNVLVERIDFAGETHVQVSVPVLSLAMPVPHSASPTPAPSVAGLIGADMLSDFDIDFDVPDRTITFYRMGDCAKLTPPWNGPYTAVPITVTRTRRLALPIELDGQSITAIFDTGASGARLALSSASRLGLTPDMLAQDPQESSTGVGGRTTKVPYHRFGQIKIGAETFRGPRIQVVDFPATEADMLIGEDYMHARRFWISYQTQVLFIQPRKTPPTVQ